MVEIKVSGDHLEVELLGWSKVWALRRRLEIPIAAIKVARADGIIPKGYYIRAFGTGIPRMISAGMFTDFKRWAFFDLRADRVNVVIMELAGWKYDAVAVQVKDARAAVEMIHAAMAAPPLPR
jgi:hypothetical protein